jgi:hypothetical protein
MLLAVLNSHLFSVKILIVKKKTQFFYTYLVFNVVAIKTFFFLKEKKRLVVLKICTSSIHIWLIANKFG